MLTLTKKSKPAKQAPIRVRNATCPRCSGPIYYDATLWLFCKRCLSPARRPIPYKLGTA